MAVPYWSSKYGLRITQLSAGLPSSKTRNFHIEVFAVQFDTSDSTPTQLHRIPIAAPTGHRTESRGNITQDVTVGGLGRGGDHRDSAAVALR